MSHTMITINNFTKGFGRDNLYEDLNVVIHLKKRITLVGKNGSGKTTFLKCLVGQEDFEGRIINNGLKISMMEQENNFNALDKTLHEHLADKTAELEAKKVELENEFGNPAIYEDEDKFNALMDRFNLLLTDSSFKIEESKLIDILENLGMDKTVLDQKISELSGGQKIKLRLAECLAKPADMYLLDEPTNHLDLNSSEWLASYILENVPSLIVISHDRYFLNQIIDEVWKIEGKGIRTYVGDYNNFEKEEITHLELLGRKFKDATREKERLLESAKKNRIWAAAAGSKNLRIVAERMERDAARIEIGINPKDLLVEIIIKFANIKLHKCQVFEFSDLSKSFGDKTLFDKSNLEIDNGERVAIIGKNGAGKTTLLKMIMELESITKGSINKRSKLSIGYFDQELEDIDPNKTVMEYLTDISGKDIGKIIASLRKFGFERSFQDQKIKSLSGGEKGRLNLLRITLEDNEILLLDEPTNNLDLNLKDSLQKAINDFPGTVIIVSHDRYFMNKVATRVLDISDQKISSYDGNYTDYLENKQE